MSRSSHSPVAIPLSQRLQTSARPVMTSEELVALGQRIWRMTTLDTVDVQVTHSARVMTRLANDRILSSDDGESIDIVIQTADQGIPPYFTVWSNQLDDAVLLAGVRECEKLVRHNIMYGRDMGAPKRPMVQDALPPGRLWHDRTVQAMTGSRETMVAGILEAIRRERLRGAGFVGLLARSNAVVLKDGGIK
jgi:hypothetical protein